MLPNLKKDADGGLTLYIQHDSPGKDKESNWLPAPEGPFVTVIRLYWPKPEALKGTWKKRRSNGRTNKGEDDVYNTKSYYSARTGSSYGGQL
jgi:hypothetical protein